MNDRYGSNVQYDMNNSSKYIHQMVMQDSYNVPNNTGNTYQMQQQMQPQNHRTNYQNIDEITNNMQSNLSIMPNYNAPPNFVSNKTNASRFLGVFNENAARPPRFNPPNGASMKLSQLLNPSDHSRAYSTPHGANAVLPISSGFQNSNELMNNNKVSLTASSHIHPKTMLNADKLSPTNPSTMFYSPANIKELNQQQIDNELKSPQWITFPPVHESAEQLRQGKQHLTINRVDNPIFMDHDLRKIYHARITSCLLSASNKSNGAKLPECVNNYIDITPLESVFEIRKSKTFNRPSICYKAYNKSTNEYVLFRRFPGLILNSDYEEKVEQFRLISHSSLIPIRHIFPTNAFDDNSLIIIMDYLPYCATALQVHVSDVGKLLGYSAPFNVTQQARPYSSKKVSDMNCLAEDRAWCYLIQIINIIRFVHNAIGMSCRVLDPSKVLIQYPNRIKLNCFGVQDILTADKSYSNNMIENSKIIAQQSTDLKNLGQLMLCLICGTAASLQESDFTIAMDLVQKNYSHNMQSILIRLMNSELECINDVAACTFAEAYNHIGMLYEHIDYLEYNLMKELECGRLFRLVCKLGTICERNELGMDANWSDYGPNYQLKLFRDFLFHQVDADGLPYLDLAHIVTSLNKLDSGSEDSVCLISRDRKNMFCVTFSELKKVLDDSFDQLMNADKN